MLAVNPELLKVFGFWGSILVLKVLFMAPLTGRQRFRKKVLANPEDTCLLKGSKSNVIDPDVERVRRAHLNDLENILPWFAITFLWITTNPSVWLASTLIKAFVLSRIAHTFVYVILAQQPLRAITFFIGYGVTLLEIFSTLMYYL